jgi:hypothetical protein
MLAPKRAHRGPRIALAIGLLCSASLAPAATYDFIGSGFAWPDEADWTAIDGANDPDDGLANEQLDFVGDAVSWSYLTEYTDLSRDQEWNVVFATISNATDHKNINADLSGGANVTDPPTAGWTPVSPGARAGNPGAAAARSRLALAPATPNPSLNRDPGRGLARADGKPEPRGILMRYRLSTKMPAMRTTLTIDDDLIEVLKALAHQRGVSFKSLVNETLRRGLTAGDKPPAVADAFRVPSARRGFRPGIDPLKLNRLADELETEGFIARDHSSGALRK